MTTQRELEQSVMDSSCALLFSALREMETCLGERLAGAFDFADTLCHGVRAAHRRVRRRRGSRLRFGVVLRQPRRGAIRRRRSARLRPHRGHRAHVRRTCVRYPRSEARLRARIEGCDDGLEYCAANSEQRAEVPIFNSKSFHDDFSVEPIYDMEPIVDEGPVFVLELDDLTTECIGVVLDEGPDHEEEEPSNTSIGVLSSLHQHGRPHRQGLRAVPEPCCCPALGTQQRAR
jgi:hypothetical protein